MGQEYDQRDKEAGGEGESDGVDWRGCRTGNRRAETTVQHQQRPHHRRGKGLSYVTQCPIALTDSFVGWSCELNSASVPLET